MSTRFAIVSMGRTGSTLLVNLLDSHPDIECRGELFGPGAEFSRYPGLGRREFLERHAFSGSAPVQGFKMPFDWILDHPGIFDDFAALDFRILRLDRAHALAHLVSIKLAELNGDWSSRATYGVQRTRITVADYHRFMGARTNTRIVLDRFSARCERLNVEYETLMDPATQRRMLDFLGVRPHALASPTVKSRTRPIAEVVENLDELRPLLSQRELATLAQESVSKDL